MIIEQHTHQSDFFKRFHGKISKVDKSGYIGIVMKSKDPIIKSGSSKVTKRRNHHESLMSGELKSKSLDKHGFSKVLNRNDVEVIKKIPLLNNESKTPILIQKHYRK